MPRRYKKGAGIASAIMSGFGDFAKSAMQMREQAALRALQAKPSAIREMEAAGMPVTPQNLLNLKTAASQHVQYGPGGEKKVTQTPVQETADQRFIRLSNIEARGGKMSPGQKRWLKAEKFKRM